MSRRTTSLVLALVLAALATVALVGYIRGLEREARAQADAVQVFVAKDRIPRGTTAEAAMQGGLMERGEVPRHSLVEGVVDNLSQIEGKVADTDIVKGEQIVLDRFVAPSRARSAFSIPDDRQAVAVEVAAPPAVAGFVEPGDRVSVIARASTGQGARVQYLVQDVEVLAVGARGTTSDDEGDGSGIGQADRTTSVVLTLALTPPEAEKVVFAVLEGEVYFTLLPEGQAPQNTPGRIPDNLFS